MNLLELQSYEIKEHKFLKDINSDAYVLTHKKTGARVVVLRRIRRALHILWSIRYFAEVTNTP